MQNPRTRLVSLRMTEEEYDQLRNAAEDRRARSVSEFARNTLLTTSLSSGVGPSWREAVETLDKRLTKVEQDVAQVKHEAHCQGSPQQHSQSEQ